MRGPELSTLFPCTTLFRSDRRLGGREVDEILGRRAGAAVGDLQDAGDVTRVEVDDRGSEHLNSGHGRIACAGGGGGGDGQRKTARAGGRTASPGRARDLLS